MLSHYHSLNQKLEGYHFQTFKKIHFLKRRYGPYIVMLTKKILKSQKKMQNKQLIVLCFAYSCLALNWWLNKYK